jgi:hypothetical protein
MGIGLAWRRKSIAGYDFDLVTPNSSPSLLWLGSAAGCLIMSMV